MPLAWSPEANSVGIRDLIPKYAVVPVRDPDVGVATSKE